jgi:hypothetical protein
MSQGIENYIAGPGAWTTAYKHNYVGDEDRNIVVQG